VQILKTVAIVFALLLLSATAKVLLRTNPELAVLIFAGSVLIFMVLKLPK